ncbi:hypothetical protein B0H21DRAFT_533803 [Amylocystis lapponica]|nr:hypothetical protein B0H21DRAFT_533803 [Amylocystis lapponica]
MSDPRFARFRTDPRFRRVRKEESKVVVDDRFKGLLDGGKKKGKKGQGRVDKYGRPLAHTHEEDHLRRFYRLDADAGKPSEPQVTVGPDYARGAILLESSDEEDNGAEKAQPGDDSDVEDVITLGRDVSRPIPVPEDDEDAEIDLDEDTFAELDAQAAAYAQENPEEAERKTSTKTRRIAVVNLDWDHVRAIHLYKIFASLVSPTAPASTSTSTIPESTSQSKRGPKGATTRIIRGRVLSVRVYPSEFGKGRMAREEKEGPPPELFKKKAIAEDEVNERNIFETGDGNDYDEDMLRKYQLERLRYYYAIVECDTVEAAAHIYSELEGTELERSANVFDLSFVPDDMTFDVEFRDEALDDLNAPYKGLEFVTDALRHSKVKLTWDEDDPERLQITRRSFSRKEIEDNDFRAYIASSTSGSESDNESHPRKSKNAKAASRDKLRSLLLSGGDDDQMPEGWSKGHDDGDGDVDMEITFMPGLSGAKDVDHDETTLEKYQRKMKEKKKRRKEETKEKEKPDGSSAVDDFFATASGGESVDVEDGEEEEAQASRSKRDKRQAKRKGKDNDADPPTRTESTAEELALLAASDNVNGEPNHFNMKAVLKAEKKRGKKKKGKTVDDGDNELQEDFAINVKDERFKAVHDDHAFAIDPSNPHFKKTKSMSALLEERSKRQKKHSGPKDPVATQSGESIASGSLKSLVESVKRKSAAAAEQPRMGKRRKV